MRRSKLKRAAAALLALAALAGGALAAAVRTDEPREPPGAGGARLVQAEAFTMPYRSLKVAAEVGGVLAAVHVDEGDEVSEGQLLVELKSDLLKASIAWREAQAEAAEAQVEAEKAASELCKIEYERAQKLDEEGVITEQDLTKARLDHKEAQYRVSQAEAAAKANRRAEELERARLRQTRLMAPRSGQVLRVLAWPGEAVDAYEPVVQVVALDPLFVIAHVPINDAARIKVGMQASLVLDGAGARPLPCSVAVVDKVADGGSGLCRVKLTLPNPDRSIAAGASGTVTFELEP